MNVTRHIIACYTRAFKHRYGEKIYSGDLVSLRWLAVAGVFMACGLLGSHAAASGADPAALFQGIPTNISSGISPDSGIVERPDAYESEFGNVRLRRPGNGWHLISAGPTKDGVSQFFGFTGPQPNEVFGVFVINPMTSGTDEEMTEAITAIFRKSGATVELRNPRAVSGIYGTELVLRPVNTTDTHRIMMWVGRYNGYGYLMMVTVSDSGNDQVAKARQLFALLSVLDPQRVAKPAATSFAQSYVSTSNGYRVRSLADGWTGYRYQGKEMPQIDYFAQFTALNLIFFTSGMDLRGTDPSLDTLAQVFLSTLSYRASAAPQRKSIQRDGITGVQLDFDGSDGRETKHVRAQVYKGGGRAYLVVTHFPVASVAAATEADLVLRQVEFSKDLAPPRASEAYDIHDREKLTTFFRALGAQYFAKKQYQSALEYYRQVWALDPLDASSLVSLAACNNFLGRYGDGLALIESNAERFSGDYDVVAYRAYFLQRLGRRDEALRYYRTAFALGKHDDEDFESYANLLWEAGKRDQALREVADYAATSDTPRIKRLVGQLYLKAENYDQAVTAYRSVLDQSPQDLQAAYGLIEGYYRLNRHQDVIALIDGLLREGNDAADVYYLKGRSEYALGWYQRAKHSFEQVLTMNPVDSGAKAYLDHVSSQLGQGDNSAVKTVLTPVPLPDVLDWDGANAAQPVAHDDAVYLLRGRAYQFQRGVELRYSNYMKVKVNSRQGVNAFSSLRYRFDPLKEQVYVNSLVVKNPEGEVIATGDVSQYYVLDDTSNGMATYDKVLNVPVPGVAPGCTIEVAVTYRSLDKAERFRFLTLPLFADYPAQQSMVSVSGDIKDLRWRMPPASRKFSKGNTVAWILRGVSAYRDEVAQDDPRRYMPYGWLSGGGTTWTGLGQGYLDDLKDRLTSDGDLRRRALELTIDAKDTQQKVRILTRFVQSTLTYKAIEFGKRGVIPNRTDEILRNRYGDCKDHALLLQQLLFAVGVEARLALVNSSGVVDEEFPSLDQFDHMIVFCPGCGKGVFIDTTEKYMEAYGPVPGGQGRALALVLDGAQSRLEPIPAYRAEDASVSANSTVRVGPNGTVHMSEQVTFSGYSAAYIRGQLLRNDPGKRLETIQSLLRMVDPGAIVERVDVTNLQDVDRPLLLSLEYVGGSQFISTDGRMVGKLPAVWERFWLNFEPSPKRETPFAIRYPWHLVTSLNVQGVDGNTLKAFAIPVEKKGDGRFVKWRSTRAGVDKNIMVHFDAQLYPGHYAPNDYDSLRLELETGLGTVTDPISVSMMEKL